MIPYLGLWKTLTVFPKIYSGKYLQTPEIKAYPCHTLEAALIGTQPAWVDVDGEAPGAAPARFRVRAGALKLLDMAP